MAKKLTARPISRNLLVDTVHLSSDEFDVSELNNERWDKLGMSQPIKPERSPLYFHGNYRDESTGIYVALSRRRLRFEFSLPKAVRGRSFTPTSPHDVKTLSDHLRRIGRFLGVGFSLQNLVPIRVDLRDDIPLNFPISVAIADLCRLNAFDRMKIAFHPNAHNQSYVRWANGNREFVAYDKSAEAEKKGEQLPPNIIRFEYRLMKRKVCAAAGITSLSSLAKPFLQRSILSNLQEKLIVEADSMLLTVGGPDSNTISELFQIACEKRAPKLVEFIAGRYGWNSFLQDFGNIHGVHRFIDQLGVDRRKRTSLKKQLAGVEKHAPTTKSPSSIWSVLRRQAHATYGGTGNAIIPIAVQGINAGHGLNYQQCRSQNAHAKVQQDANIWRLERSRSEHTCENVY